MTKRRDPRTPADDDRVSSAEDATDDDLLTVEDVARLMKVPMSWVYEHSRQDGIDRLPCIKLGKYLRFRLSDLRNYIESKRTAGRR